MPSPDLRPDSHLPEPSRGGSDRTLATNPYVAFVQGFERLMDEARNLPLGGFPREDPGSAQPAAPVALVFAPHPDDECIVGALPLRLRRELGHRIVAIAVTQGSRIDRQAARLNEMRAACNFLGFELEAVSEGGLAGLHPERRSPEGMSWDQAVACIAQLLLQYQPARIFLPHETDQNTTHQGTHHLVMDALRRMEAGFSCQLLETEFWAPMADPNVMVESSVAEVADLVAATSFHRGEVQRNPYHLRLPSWMSDNVRRGGELVGGQGGSAPDYHFATLYRMSLWKDGARSRSSDVVMAAAGTSLGSWFGAAPSAP